MPTDAVIHVDLADVFAQPNRKDFLHSLAWGDYVRVLETTSTHLRVSTTKYEKESDGSILPVATEAYIWPTKSSGVKPAEVVIPAQDNRVLKVNFVDVQQGDGAVIESPDGKVILVDGGDNQLFARYLAARFRDTSAQKPKDIDCIVVTHGDADHFLGLTKILESEQNPEPRKQLFLAPRRVYHNGLVKRPGREGDKAVPEKTLFGPTQEIEGETIVTGLVDNLLTVPDQEMNENFLKWKETLSTWNQRRPIQFRRLSFGMDDAFDFFKNDNLEISVLGPLLTTKGEVSGLKFLGNPRKGPRVGHASPGLDTKDFTGLSASHTINGHSIVFRLRYGGFSYLFTGDLNDEAGRTLSCKYQQGDINLRAEVLKVPHHGSADFSGAFLQMVAPLVSVISCGDESAEKEYIHPRATLLGALGKYSRTDEPLILVTELVAFLNKEGWAKLTDKNEDKEKVAERGEFFSFSRAAYGIVKTRTDGSRLLIYTDSGKTDMKEAYCYTLDQSGQPIPAPVVRA